MPHLPATLDGLETPGQGRTALRWRRSFVALLVAFVLAGTTGLLGVRTTTISAAEDGWEISVEHATIARAGLDVPWTVTLTHDAGFDGDVTLAVTGDYFDIYESQGFNPEPSDETRDGDTRFLTFSPPAGRTLVVSYDAYIQPSAQLGRSGTVAVVVDGRRLAPVGFRTVLLP
ncbi:hypothetical protein [uncultured Phycicoccus sp.]|uniref:hypothetical protein n=1 Tax=uncultured Phycicoccus sp. TaxID=661422 RepID=UPI0026265663|nr:hypothetical protein [uncultured Phycicoccus sp.]